MKRLLALFLSLALLLSLAACGKKDPAGKEDPGEGTDLSALDGKALYEYGTEKAVALKSARYTSVLSREGEAVSELETVRVRSGYDSFLWSRTGAGLISFDGKEAFVQSDLGNYTAPATSRLFQEYLDECVYPVSALNPQALENFERKGDTVSYESADRALLRRYGQLALGFVPTALSGKATFSQEGIITAEDLVITGLGSAGEETAYEVKTVLAAYRSEEIVAAAPESTDGFITVSDIRLPQRIQNAMTALLGLEELQATLVIANTATLPEKNFSLNRDLTIYQSKEGSYLSRQSLKSIPEVPEESLFYQCQVLSGVKTENTYNIITGEKISENVGTGDGIFWQEEIRAVLPALSGFSSLDVVEDVDGYSVTFTLTEDYAKGFAAVISDSMGAIPEVKDVAVGECTGTLSIRKSDMVLGALSYTVSGVFRSEAESGSFTVRYSVLLDRTEGVSLPPLQTPTPTVPGQMPEFVPEDLP